MTARTFECPKCRQRITVHISPLFSPRCTRHHSQRSVEMIEVTS